MSESVLTADQVLAKLADLKLSLPAGVSFRVETLLAKLEGWGAKRHIQRKYALIVNVAGLLQRMLKPGEEVLYVGKGVYASFVEQYFMGVMVASLVNQTVFVLTNLRLIMLHSNTKGVPGHSYGMIYYSQIKTFRESWTGAVNLVLLDGTSLKFSGFEKLDRAQMPAVFEAAMRDYRILGFNPAVSQSREHVCTHCFEIVPRHQFQCPACQAEFWKPSALALRSSIFPSWGNFLMRHIVVAVLELMGYALTWGFVLLQFANALSGGIAKVVAAVLVAVIVLGMAHVGDACLTYFVARKGLHPKRTRTN